jgi:hypothetical protein
VASGHQTLASPTGEIFTGILSVRAGVGGIQCRVRCAAGIVCNVITSSTSVLLRLKHKMKTFMCTESGEITKSSILTTRIKIMHEWLRNNVIFQKYARNVRSVDSGERSRHNFRSIITERKVAVIGSGLCKK